MVITGIIDEKYDLQRNTTNVVIRNNGVVICNNRLYP